MLKRIRCDKFLSIPNHEILFKDGLNVVLGDSESSNSIGKSTLLMIIDFCFGGEDYIDKEKDTLNNGDIKEAHNAMSSVKSSKAFKVESTIWMAEFV